MAHGTFLWLRNENRNSRVAASEVISSVANRVHHGNVHAKPSSSCRISSGCSTQRAYRASRLPTSECLGRAVQLSWLHVRTAPTLEDRPALSGREPVQEERCKTQGQNCLASSARGPGEAAEGRGRTETRARDCPAFSSARSHHLTNFTLVRVERDTPVRIVFDLGTSELGRALVGISSHRQSRPDASSQVPGKTPQATRTRHTTVPCRARQRQHGRSPPQVLHYRAQPKAL
jgi:hypothetical protein